MKDLKKAIFKTLSYADIFNYPLKKDEIYRFLIADKKVSHQLFNKAFREIKEERKWVGARGGFYFLKGCEKVFSLREAREGWSRKKLKIAKRVANFLKTIPTVKMIAVTGALAMGNSKKEDDIDLLVVTENGRIWATRFLVTILVEAFAKRRRPKDRNVADKICLNMFLDEEHLEVPKNERDLFTAHEVVQLKPLWDRDTTYQKFLAANQWVKKFLPNAIIQIKNKKLKIKITYQNLKIFDKFCILACHFAFCILNFAFVEELLKRFQLYYMKKRRTTEVISDGVIRFHPRDARVWVLKEYQKRVDLLAK